MPIDGNLIKQPFEPSVDNTGYVGSAAKRWSEINGVVVRTGDLELKRGNAHWLIEEETDGLFATNIITGRRYRIALEPVR